MARAPLTYEEILVSTIRNLNEINLLDLVINARMNPGEGFHEIDVFIDLKSPFGAYPEKIYTVTYFVEHGNEKAGSTRLVNDIYRDIIELRGS